MRKLVVFEQISLDGYFVDGDGDMSWAHRSDPEWNAFVEENAAGGGVLIFGRLTYELMASFWPTPAASQMAPVVAAQMNALPKVVFSTTLREGSWQNTTLFKGDLVAEVRRLKAVAKRDLLIMGSGSVVAQLAGEDLIDEYQMVVNPLVLGRGRSLFHAMNKHLFLQRTKTRAFSNGNVLLCYERLG